MSELLERLAQHSLSAEQSAIVCEFVETHRQGASYVGAILDVLERDNRQLEIPGFLADFAKKMLEVPRATAAPNRTSSIIAPCGPLERWGYDGPVTARLPEKEWWPLRWSILERDNFTCAYCSERPQRMCADHVVPLSRGGTNDPDNLVACCLPCNSSKADRLLSEWKGRWR